MKQILIALLVAFSLIASAQSKNRKVQRIKHAQLLEMTLLSELVGDLPAGVSVRYEMMGTIDGKIIDIHCMGPLLCADVRMFFKEAKAKTIFYMIVQSADRKTKLKDLVFKIVD